MGHSADDMAMLLKTLDESGLRYSAIDEFVVRVGWSSQPVDYWTFWAFPPLSDSVPFSGKVEIAAIPEYFVPGKSRASVPQLLNSINWGMSIGNWEMDPEDGQLRLRVTVPTTAEPAGSDFFGFLMALVSHEMGRGMPAIMSVGQGEATPEQAMVFLDEGLSGMSMN